MKDRDTPLSIVIHLEESTTTEPQALGVVMDRNSFRVLLASFQNPPSSRALVVICHDYDAAGLAVSSRFTRLRCNGSWQGGLRRQIIARGPNQARVLVSLGRRNTRPDGLSITSSPCSSYNHLENVNK